VVAALQNTTAATSEKSSRFILHVFSPLGKTNKKDFKKSILALGNKEILRTFAPASQQTFYH
jgi:hypothetical protein